MNLENKVAIVTGGGRDIGLACVRHLARAGARVAINYNRSAAGAVAAAEEIVAAGGDAFALQGDMTSEADVAKLVEATRLRFGPTIDILVHVTGGLVARKKLRDLDLAHWHAVMNLNATSFYLVTRAVEPHMPNGGAIVAIASQAARDGGGAGAIAYGAAKGAVMTMTRGLAKELGPRIRVNSLCPGMIDTDFHAVFTSPEVRKAVAGNTPLKREGTTDDCAALVTFLASDAAAFITGANYDINGGTVFS